MNEASNSQADLEKAKLEKWGSVAFLIHVAETYVEINGPVPYTCHRSLVEIAFAEASRLQTKDISGEDFHPSLFKKLGFLTVKLLRDNVFSTPFRKGRSQSIDQIADNGRYASSCLILLYAISCMEDSVIDTFPKAPKRRIFLSDHSRNDIVEALATIHSEESSYRIISSLYEQIFYKTHPEHQYAFCEDYPLIVDPIKIPLPQTN